MPLAIDYRPRNLKEFEGNTALKNALGSVMKRDIKDIPHAFLFCGMTGCGKTTLARIVAKMLKCDSNEFYEMNSADFRGIDTIRDIARQARFQPMNGNVRVWLFDECHKLSPDAQEAMLKLLEDAPEHVYYILATTDPQKLKPTLKGRCTTFEVKPIEADEMVEFMLGVLEEEDAKVPEKVLRKIAIDSNGSARNALQILERIYQLPEKEMAEAAEQTAESEAQTIDLCRALMKDNNWKEIAKILTDLQTDPEQVRYAVLGYCQSILLKGQANKKAALIMDCFKEPFYTSMKPGLTLACFESQM